MAITKNTETIEFDGEELTTEWFVDDKGRKQGEFLISYSNGQVSQIGKYKDDKPVGVWEFFHRNGKLYSTQQEIGGKNFEKFISYHKNGKIKTKEKFVDGIETGEWIYFSPEGKEEKREFYINGKLQ